MAREYLGAAPTLPGHLATKGYVDAYTPTVVVHGSNPNLVRPSTTNAVIWFGSVDPVNSDDSKDVTVYVATEGSNTNYTETGYDIVLLMGQSNMSGRATVDTAKYDVPSPLTDQFAIAGPQSGTISAAVDPLGHPDYVALGNSLGPATAFARWYQTIMPAGRRLLLVPAAYGGTPLVSTATLGWRRGVAGNLYDQAVSQLNSAINLAGSAAKVVAALWIQGEQDGNVNTTGAAYQTDLDALITGLRTDLGIPTLPFIIGQMVPEYLSTGTRAAIDTVQAATPTRLSYVGYTPGPTNRNLGDGNHYDAIGQRLLGKYLFTAYRQVVFGGPAPVQDDGNVYFTNSVAPTITGTLTTGSVLTANVGTWSPTPTSYQYQWYSGGAAISGATNSTYTLTALDVGAVMSVKVTAVRAGYPNKALTSVNTGYVTSSGTTYSADTFNRANSTTTLGSTTTGAFAWQVLSGTWGILSNAAYDPASVASVNHAAVVNDAQADGTIVLTIGAIGTNANNGGIVFRATDDSNYLLFTSAGTVYTRVAGVNTNIGGVTNLVSTNGTILSVTLSGSTIIVRQNGIVIWSGTSTVNQTATRHGMRAYGGNTTLTYDQFTHTA